VAALARQANQPIIIKKARKGGRHGHHGGSWKVAYADFVTAMMAFFLLLWLLNVTTNEQRLGIANYFMPTPYIKDARVGSTGFSGGHSLDDTGQLNAPSMTMPGIMIGLPPHDGMGDSTREFDFDGLSEQEVREQIERAEEAELERVTRELRRAVADDPALRELGRNLLVDRTPEGVRIQILDAEQPSMFPLGSAAMYPYTRSLMAKVVRVVEPTHRPLSITGHTDSVPFRAGSERDN
jgi:chemotaxis protein MotB